MIFAVGDKRIRRNQRLFLPEAESAIAAGDVEATHPQEAHLLVRRLMIRCPLRRLDGDHSLALLSALLLYVVDTIEILIVCSAVLLIQEQPSKRDTDAGPSGAAGFQPN